MHLLFQYINVPTHYWSIIMASGAGAVEYIICHAEVSVAFAEETKIFEVRMITLHLETLLEI